jgi:hypothetical protein
MPNINSDETLGRKNDNVGQNNTSTSIAVDSGSENRLGIINVMFYLDPNILNWAAGTFYDGKIVTTDDKKQIIVPNSERYTCNICNDTKTINDWDYATCRGTKENPHPPNYRTPVDWHPLTSRTGITCLLSQLQIGMNSNIQTGNFSKNLNDIKGKADLDTRLTNLATNQAVSGIGAVLSNPKNYAEWLLTDKTYSRLPEVFNIPFLENVMTGLAINLLASLSKGKNMEAVSKVLENRAHIEQEITNKSERSQLEQQLDRNNNSGWGGLFNFVKDKK